MEKWVPIDENQYKDDQRSNLEELVHTTRSKHTLIIAYIYTPILIKSELPWRDTENQD